VNVAPDNAVPVTRFEKQLAAGDYTLTATVSDSKGRPLGRNEWSFRVDAPPIEPSLDRITTEKRRLEKRPAEAMRPGDKRRQR
jgi:hypothetical protein